MTRRVAIYTRISRDRVGAGLGVDRQEQDCRLLAATLGWSIVKVYRDNDLSAYSGKPRPGYLQMLQDIRTGLVDAVIAWHTDRLHRSPTELEEYIAACDPRGVPTHTVKAGPLDLSSPAGRMVARALGAVARYEVEHMIERQQRAKLQVATEGRWRGGRRPYGYEDDGVTVRESEATEVLHASRQVLAGTTLNRLAVDMNRRGLTTSTGGAWRQDTLRRVLMRPRNAGLMELHGEVIGQAGWPAIVPEDIWRGVCAVLGDPARRTRTSTARIWLGSGLFRCFCGAPVRASTAGGQRNQRTAYMCTAGKHVARVAAEVDEYIGAVVVAWLSKPAAARVLAGRSVDTSALHVRAQALRARLDELAALFATGELTKSQLSVGTQTVRLQLEQVEAQLASAGRGSALAGLADVTDPERAWQALDLDRRRAVVSELMTVTLQRSRKGRRPGWRPGESYFDPASVQIVWR